MDSKALVERALSWVRQHPLEIVEAVRNAAGLRATVPLDALRWLAAQAKGRKAPKDVEILAVPPGVRVAATLDVMKTSLRAGATLYIDEVRLGRSEFRIELRVRDIELAVLGESDSPVATLIQSGALDLRQPGKLLKHLPKRPPMVVDADGDRIVLDLMRDPKLARKIQKAASLTPLVTVRSVETSADHLQIQLACIPEGLSTAFEAIRASV